MNAPEPEYDPATCVTAGELRAMGASIPANVPDCGWIPRSGMRTVSIASAGTPEDIAAGMLCVNLAVEITAPFRWLEVKVEAARLPT